jgi:hypothetical protein
MEKTDDIETLSIIYTLEYISKLKKEEISSTEIIEKTHCNICGKQAETCLYINVECKEISQKGIKKIAPTYIFTCERCAKNPKQPKNICILKNNSAVLCL